MLTSHLNSDTQKAVIINLVNKLKKQQTDLGGYIEHFYYNERIIIVKLTNGFIKINELLIEKYHTEADAITENELLKICNTFVKTQL